MLWWFKNRKVIWINIAQQHYHLNPGSRDQLHTWDEGLIIEPLGAKSRARIVILLIRLQYSGCVFWTNMSRNNNDKTKLVLWVAWICESLVLGKITNIFPKWWFSFLNITIKQGTSSTNKREKVFILHPERFNLAREEWWDWKTSLFYWVSVTFQRWAVELREGILLHLD